MPLNASTQVLAVNISLADMMTDAHIFHDITNGTNPGCGTIGFSAVEGWDPITGLGTPDYNKLLEVFMSLP